MLYLTVPNLHFPVIILQQCFQFAHSPTLQIVLYALEVISHKTNNISQNVQSFSIPFSGKNLSKHFGQPNIIILSLHTSLLRNYKIINIKL